MHAARCGLFCVLPFRLPSSAVELPSSLPLLMPLRPCLTTLSTSLCSGLDNAGKTTIVKRISGEDASTVSPTLGFNIKTLEFAG